MSIANELITHGWYQGNYEGPDGSLCLIGAARNVYGDQYDRYVNALRVLYKLVGGMVGGWNDNPTRTFDEVLRVAKEADEILDGLT